MPTANLTSLVGMRTPPKRKQTREKFTTYLNISTLESWTSKADGPPWLRDERLSRHLKHHEQNLANPQERFWVVYWHSQWKRAPQSLARGHLVAYLQTPCFWAAYSFSQTLNKTPYSVIDCFQICFALETRNQELGHKQILFEKILHKFNPEIANNLSGYAQTIFKNALAHEIYKLTKVRTCTDWSLLNHKDIGEEVLKHALEREGLSDLECRQIRLMRKCFKLYFDGRSPNAFLWEQAAKAYNRTRLNYGNWPAIAANDLEDNLQLCAKAIRSFYSLSTRSLDTPIGNEASGSKTLGEVLEDPYQVAQAERIANTDLWHQAETLLVRVFQALPQNKQTLLLLKYSSHPKLDNYAIADRLNFEGTRVRKGNKVTQALKSTKLKLAKALIPWVERNLHNPSDSPLDVMEGVTKAVDMWLEEYFIPDRALRENPSKDIEGQ